MNKSEIIELVAQKADISKNKAGEAIDAFIKAIGESLAKGEDVSILGFGTFSVSERGSRMHNSARPSGAGRRLSAAKGSASIKGVTLEHQTSLWAPRI